MIEVNNKLSIDMLKLICAQSNSLVAGFILYDERHPYLVKVLRQTEFWDALDSISGRNWPIFAVNPQELPQNKYGCNANFKSQIKVFLDLFGLNGSDDLPCFVVFTWDNDNKLLHNYYALSDSSEKEAFESIKNLVSDIADTERQIKPEYRNGERVYLNSVIYLNQMITQQQLRKILPELLSIFIKLS